MGNVPTKEPRSRLLSFGTTSGTQPSRSRRHTTLSLLGNNFGSSSANNPLFGNRRGFKAEDKLKSKEKHYLDLVVRHTEVVDGGFMAPYGIYKLNLDYNTEIVRGLVASRRLAPFYTPLQDFDDSWTDDELVTIVRQLTLHAFDSAYSEEEEDDADDHKIHHLANYFRRQELKKKLTELMDKMKEFQKRHEKAYEEAKTSGKSEHVASRDLVLALYRNATECPICFLYFPPHLNVSRCCGQPICTECFVQIKRLDPHPPHDDHSGENKDELPHTLILEYANCPYCAMTNFGVTYDPPAETYLSMGGPRPLDFVTRASIDVIPEESAISSLPEGSMPGSPIKAALAIRKPRRRASVAADAPEVITTDYIRPDWEQRLAGAKSKLARKAATASAIHALNLLLDDGGRRDGTAPGQFLQTLEDRMVEEAMRLSLLEEEERNSAK